MSADLGSVPVHRFAAAGHPAVDGLLAPGSVVGKVLPLVDWGRHVADLVVAPELGTVWDIKFELIHAFKKLSVRQK